MCGLDTMNSGLFGTVDTSSSVMQQPKKDFQVHYDRINKPTYASATQPGGLRTWKPAPKPSGFATQPPRGYGVYTDFVTQNQMLNVLSESLLYFCFMHFVVMCSGSCFNIMFIL